MSILLLFTEKFQTTCLINYVFLTKFNRIDLNFLIDI